MWSSTFLTTFLGHPKVPTWCSLPGSMVVSCLLGLLSLRHKVHAQAELEGCPDPKMNVLLPQRILLTARLFIWAQR